MVDALSSKMPGNGRKKILTDKENTNNVPVTFLDVRVLTEK